jgi:penicillin-binding protein 1A
LLTVALGGVAVGACLAALIPGVVEVATAHHYTTKTVGKLSVLAQPSTIYWDDGTAEMGTLGTQFRQPVTLDQVPKLLQDAVIATEDRTFWTNDGIDLGGTFRAFLTNLTSGKIEQGGSTITQQLVKNRILSSKRTVNRKVKEIEDALRLNEKFSKQKILEEYLNTIYLGSGSYGVKAAAARYFLAPTPGTPYVHGKTLKELTVGESALLAGLIANPEGDNPFTHPDRAVRRRADVLRSMVEEGYITQAQADAANNEPLPTIQPPAEQRPHDYLVAEVQDQLLADPRLGATVKERQDALLKGGLKIVTTFNQNLQTAAVNATTNDLPFQLPGWISALVSMDPGTGAVKAMVGGSDFTQNQYNIATHPVGRQPGSTWKVITLAGALQNGYSPNDIVDGSAPCSVPSHFGDLTTTNAEEGGGTESLWSATAESVNCAFVRLSTSVGQDKLIDLAHQMGIAQTRPTQNDKILTLSIGSIEATPLEMADVMSTVASGGIHRSPYVVARVVAPDGKVLLDNTNQLGSQVLDADVAACEQNVLRGVVMDGTGTKAAVDGQEIFGKTGTTDDKSNAWFIGANPSGFGTQLATAVWFGYAPRNLPGAGFGGDSAAPIFQAFMSAALAGQPDTPLPDPGPVCQRAGAWVNPDGGHGAPIPVQPVEPAPTEPPPDTSPPATAAPPPTTAAPPPTSAPATPGQQAPPGNGGGPQGQGHGGG